MARDEGYTKAGYTEDGKETMNLRGKIIGLSSPVHFISVSDLFAINSLRLSLIMAEESQRPGF